MTRIVKKIAPVHCDWKDKSVEQVIDEVDAFLDERDNLKCYSIDYNLPIIEA